MHRFGLFAVAATAAWLMAPRAGVADERGDPVIVETLATALPRLGHRNWIVIADSAYPEQTGAGIETIYAGGDQLEVVEAVLAAVDAARHVEAVPIVDAELAVVDEADAPGITAYRDRLARLLEGRPVDKLPHEEIIRELDEAGRLFRVLVIKTDMALPYTSVFLRLECGYWSPEKEARLRESLLRARSGRAPFEED